MNIEDLRMYCIEKKGVSESFPFSRLPNLLVFKVGSKMFLATDLDQFNGFSIKCRTETIEELKASHTCLVKAPYANPKHWLLVDYDGSEDEQLLKKWIDTSYDLVLAKLSKKERLDVDL